MIKGVNCRTFRLEFRLINKFGVGTWLKHVIKPKKKKKKNIGRGGEAPYSAEKTTTGGRGFQTPNPVTHTSGAREEERERGVATVGELGSTDGGGGAPVSWAPADLHPIARRERRGLSQIRNRGGRDGASDADGRRDQGRRAGGG